jgi:hypothetical protein
MIVEKTDSEKGTGVGGEGGRVTGARRVADGVLGWSLEPLAELSTGSRTPLYQSSN